MKLARLSTTLLIFFIALATIGAKEFDYERYELYFDKAHNNLYTNTDSVYHYSQKLLALGIEYNDSIVIGEAYHVLAYANYYKNNSKEALKYFKLAEKVFINLKMPDLIAIIYMDLGNLYSDWGQLETCLNYYERAEHLMLRYSQNSSDIVLLYYNMGHVFLDLNDLDNLERYITKAEVISIRDSIENLYAAIENMKSYIAHSKGNLDEAESLSKNALKHSRADKDLIEEIFALENLGRTYCKREDRTKAIAYSDSAVALSYTYDDSYIIATQLSVLSQIHLHFGLYGKANELAEKAYSVKDRDESLLLTNKVGKIYASTLEKVGKYKEALRVSKEAQAAEDSIPSFELSEKILESEKALSEKKNELLQAESTLLKANNSKNKVLIIATSIALVLSLGIISLMILNLKVRKKAAAKLKKQQQVIDNNTIELEIKNKELEKINKGKDMLFSVISHDMKQPFNQVSLFVDLLEASPKVDESLKELVVDIRESTATTLCAMNNLLLWSKSQFLNIKTEPEDIPINEMIAVISEEASTALKSKKIELKTEIDSNAKIYADRIHVEIIIRNLVGNAIKFSGDGQTIHLKIVNQENGTDLIVQDFGKGMSKEELEQLLDKQKYFSTPGTLNEKGTGLGLLLVTEYAEKNSGKLYVESEENKGSIFRIRFPKSKEAVL